MELHETVQDERPHHTTLERYAGLSSAYPRSHIPSASTESHEAKEITERFKMAKGKFNNSDVDK